MILTFSFLLSAVCSSRAYADVCAGADTDVLLDVPNVCCAGDCADADAGAYAGTDAIVSFCYLGSGGAGICSGRGGGTRFFST